MKRIYEIVWEAEKVTPKPITYGHDSVTTPKSTMEKLNDVAIYLDDVELDSIINSEQSREWKVEGLLKRIS